MYIFMPLQTTEDYTRKLSLVRNILLVSCGENDTQPPKLAVVEIISDLEKSVFKGAWEASEQQPIGHHFQPQDQNKKMRNFFLLRLYILSSLFL